MDLNVFQERFLLAARLAKVVALPSADTLGLLAKHAALLDKWNQTHNLTSVKGLDAWVDALFFDSWLVTALDPGSTHTLVDIGSGGGFPALVLLAGAPTRRALLFEKVEKKRSFLTVAGAALGLSATQIAKTGFPGPLPNGPRAWTSRATFAPEAWLSLAASYATPGDVIIVQGSQEMLPPAPIGWRLDRSIETELPLTKARRRLGAYTWAEAPLLL